MTPAEAFGSHLSNTTVSLHSSPLRPPITVTDGLQRGHRQCFHEVALNFAENHPFSCRMITAGLDFRVSGTEIVVMKSAVTTFLTFRLGSQPRCGVLALTRVVERDDRTGDPGGRFNYEDVDRGGELRGAGVSYDLVDLYTANIAGVLAEFLCRVYNAAAEKLETAYEVIESDASTVTWTPYDAVPRETSTPTP